MSLQPYDLIPAEQNPLLSTFAAACVPLETYTYHFMTKMCREHYRGGMWEFRKYPNGALCMVFPDAETMIDPVTFNGNYVTCSLEAVSYAAWLIVLSSVGMELHNKNANDPLCTVIHDHYHGLLDALSGRVRFIIEPGKKDTREPTLEELNQFAERLLKHPELASIGSIID